MAVCNLFSELTSDSGNFLMFSQYVEDLTRNYAQGDTYKVVPSKFIALNIEYSKINIPAIGNSTDLNKDIPKYFQNYFENGCAYGNNYNDIVKTNADTTDDTNQLTWTPDKAKNLFWSSLYDGNFITAQSNEIMCINDINLNSYNIHNNMGYNEIYCYIPTNKKQEKYSISVKTEGITLYQNENTSLEGFPVEDFPVTGPSEKVFQDNIIYQNYNENYKNYCYDERVTYSKTTENAETTCYNINTIIVLYSIYEKQNNEWKLYNNYQDIPMGIYFAGKFNGTNISNPINKHVDTDASTGTAYGLRICTRFSATSQGRLINTDISTENNSNELSNICQLMTAMNENLSAMLDISRNAISENQGYKDLLSIIRNNRTNVPYIKNINGTDYWFVNGRLVSSIPPQQPTT